MVQIQSTYFPTRNLTLKRAFLHTRKRSSKGFCCWSLIEMPDTSWPTDYIIQKPMAIFNDYWNSTAAFSWPLTSFLQLWHFIVDTIGFWHTIRKVPLLSVHHYYWRSCNTINVKSSKKTFFSDQCALCALETAQWAQQRATHEHQKVQIHSSSTIGCTQGKGGNDVLWVLCCRNLSLLINHDIPFLIFARGKWEETVTTDFSSKCKNGKYHHKMVLFFS